MPPRKALKHATQYSVGWIAALSHELAAALTMLDERHDKPESFQKNRSDQNSYSFGKIGLHNVVIASLPLGEYGLVSAADTASGMRASLPHIRVGLLVGIGAGLPGEKVASDGSFTLRREILLGDVVVSSPDGTNGGVVQYDLIKAKRVDGQALRERKGFLNSPPRALRSALAQLQAEHMIGESRLVEFLEAFQRKAEMSATFGYPGTEKDHLRTPKSRKTAKIHYGTIASGNTLVKDSEHRNDIENWLEQENIVPLCYEMEAAGLMNSFPCLVIRGICDYANEHKNDEWQKYAAATAAAFAKDLLQYMSVDEVEMAPKISESLEQITSDVVHIKQDVQSLISAGGQSEARENRHAVLNWLNPPRPRPPVTERREPGTNLWFLEGDLFHAWFQGRKPYVFLHGGVGCGKTTLNKAIAEQATSHGGYVMTFYFSSTANEEYGINALLRFLVAKLCESEQIPEQLQGIYDAHNRAFPPEPPDDDVELEDIVQTLLETRGAANASFLLIDGLDEISSTSVRRAVTSYLRVLAAQKLANLRILVTARPAGLITELQQEWTQVAIPSERVRDDIETYVTRRVLEQGQLVALHSDLRQQIVERLAGPGQSMFRYAYLQLERLLDSGLLLRSSDVAATLRELPTTLNETYHSILGQIKRSHRDLALKALRWLTYAPQPLLMAELIEACKISLEDGEVIRHEDSLTPDQLLTLLPNLITLQESDETEAVVVFTHFSVKEYLVDGLIPGRISWLQLGSLESHSFVARSCVAYLFATNTEALVYDNHALRSYAWDFWSFHAAAGSDVDNIQQQAQFLTELAILAGKDDLSNWHLFRETYPCHALHELPNELKPLFCWRADSEPPVDLLDCLRYPYFFTEYRSGWGPHLLPLRNGEIRLLKLHPSRHSCVPLRCSIFVASLSVPNTPKYDAISYSWGDAGKPVNHSIWLNGHPARLSKSAMINLQTLRTGNNHVQCFWVDSLSVEYTNLDERNEQVALLPKICSQAERVAACLDNSDDEDLWALQILLAVDKLLQSYSDARFDELVTALKAGQGICPFERIRKLFSHPWFKRMWTVQEVVFSKRASIVLDGGVLPFETLEFLVTHSARMANHIKNAHYWRPLDKNTLLESPSWDRIQSLCSARQHYQRGEYLSLTQLIYTTRCFHISNDSRSRYFAIYGMLHGSDLVVDYSMTRKEVCGTVTLSAFIADQNLDLLSIGTSSTHSVDFGYRNHQEKMPTWAGIFLWTRGNHLIEDWPVPLLHLELSAEGSSEFCAGKQSFDVLPFVRPLEPELEPSPQSWALHLEGYTVDTVALVSDSPIDGHVEDLNFSNDITRHRQWCYTAHGRQGLISLAARPGDTLAVIIGGKTPYVLRALETSDDSDLYQFMGECYMPGMMHGEVVEAARVHGRYQLRPIVLV